ncbi:MAG: EMC3/TMCO1 family protein [Candidatus Aenigmatarchaeota archaeon]
MFEVIFKPHILLLIISSSLTLFLFFLNRLLVKKDVLKEIKERIMEIRENLARAQASGNNEEINKYLNELLKVNSEYMRQNLKILLVSMLVIIAVLPFISNAFSSMTVSIPFEIPFIGSKLNWSIWYILVSFSVGWAVKRLLEGE